MSVIIQLTLISIALVWLLLEEISVQTNKKKFEKTENTRKLKVIIEECKKIEERLIIEEPATIIKFEQSIDHDGVYDQEKHELIVKYREAITEWYKHFKNLRKMEYSKLNIEEIKKEKIARIELERIYRKIEEVNRQANRMDFQIEIANAHNSSP